MVCIRYPRYLRLGWSRHAGIWPVSIRSETFICCMWLPAHDYGVSHAMKNGIDDKFLAIICGWIVVIAIILVIANDPRGMQPVIKDMASAIAPIITGIFGIVTGYAIGTAVNK